MTTCPIPVAAALAALALAAPAPGQGQVERHPELGITLRRPTGYERMPVRPRERFCVLAYRALDGDATLAVYVVPRDTYGGESVHDAESFLKQETRAVKMQELHPGRERFGHEPRRWEGVALGADQELEALYLHAWTGEQRVILVEGRCSRQEYAGRRRLWELTAASMRLQEPRDLTAERAKLERYYGQHRYRGRTHRIDARLSLVEGWDAVDTEHFIVLHHGVDARFVRTITEHLEALQREFEKLCPPDRTQDVVSSVRVCRDEAEYLAYGGTRGSVGYWSPSEEELVFFDARELNQPGIDGEHYTLTVLHHEAFHQYVFYSAEQMSPASWYDEGLAEYFGGAQIVGGRLREMEPNRYRLPRIQNALRDGEAYPLKTVVGLTLKEFYADPQVLYAQGWSLVHFLLESKEARRHPRWKRVLPTYFDILRSGWAIERKRLGGATPEAYEAARARVREKARKAAFGEVDWAALEQAWAQHVMTLALPRAH